MWKPRELVRTVIENGEKMHYCDYHTKIPTDPPKTCSVKSKSQSTMGVHVKSQNLEVEKYYCPNPKCPKADKQFTRKEYANRHCKTKGPKGKK